MGHDATEYEICKVIADFARLYNLPFFHISNEGKRSKFTGARLKAIGLIPGTPDYFFMHLDKKGLFLEVKTKRGRPTKTQIEFIERVQSLGYYGAICYGLDACLEVICAFYGVTL